MNRRPDIIERAYQLAASGEVDDILHIKTRLNQEGYFEIDAHLDGSKIRGDLKRRIAAAREAGKSATGEGQSA